MDIETIKRFLENNGVLCQIRNRHYTYHPELDYDYIKCYKDGLEFETTLKEGDLPVLQFVCILNGQRYGLNRMIKSGVARKECLDFLLSNKDYIGRKQFYEYKKILTE